jgi:hypothetical protein
MIKIFVLYVGIIAAIQNHTNDHCRRKVSGHVYIYPNPLGHTLKGLASIEYEFGIRSKGERLQKWLRKCQNGSNISQMVPEGSKTLPTIYRKVLEEIRSN